MALTIDLENGLQLDEVLKIAQWLKVAGHLEPALHARLSTGTDSLLGIMTALQNVPWLLGLLPGNIGAQLNGGVDALRVMKELLAA